eukprot:2054362-Pyramimonas_sp.AAC.2
MVFVAMGPPAAMDPTHGDCPCGGGAGGAAFRIRHSLGRIEFSGGGAAKQGLNGRVGPFCRTVEGACEWCKV